MPDFLKKYLSCYYNEEEINTIMIGFKEKRYVTFRVNTLKGTKEEVLKILEEEQILYESVSWYKDAFLIKNKREVELKQLAIYKEGKIYIQSLSSMMPPLFLHPKEKEQILDMTAAPGGKTTEIAALTNNCAMITAVEKNKIRMERLKYNIALQGASKVTVLNKDARELDPYFIFDKILLDAPCSGSGTLNENTFSYFSEELLNRSIKVQEELLNEAIKHVRVGGEILYSTCSILKEENEYQIEKLLKAKRIEIVPINLDDTYKDISLLPVTIKGTLCIMPTKEYEGFYLAKIKRIL